MQYVCLEHSFCSSVFITLQIHSRYTNRDKITLRLITAEHQRTEFKLPCILCTYFVCSYIKHYLQVYLLGPQESQTVNLSVRNRIADRQLLNAISLLTRSFLCTFQKSFALIYTIDYFLLA